MLYLAARASDYRARVTNRSALCAFLLLLGFASCTDAPIIESTSKVSPEPGYSARDLSPDGLQSGRTNGTVFDPFDSSRAITVSAGGLFGSTDGGKTWSGNFNEDGTPGPFGQGLEDGLTLFGTVAFDPFVRDHLLLLVEDDNRADPAKRRDGIWGSNDGGRSFVPLAPNPCGALGPVRFVNAHIRFSQDQNGLVVSSSNCGVGISTDHGVTWSFIAPDGDPTTAHWVEGIDLYPAGGTLFGFLNTSDIIGFCFADSLRKTLSLGFYDIATGTTRFESAPRLIQNSGSCDFAFDPRNSNHFFIAGDGTDGIREKGLYEGLALSSTFVLWTDLDAPSGAAGAVGKPGNRNGRPAVVQVHRHGGGIRIYYNDTVDFRYEDCSSLFLCPTGAPLDPAHYNYEHCPGDNPSGPWRCLNPLHTDSSEIAFDPTQPTTACPVLIGGDGGTQHSDDCGSTWSFVSGIHTLSCNDAAFAGTGDRRRIWLANFDNGTAARATDGTWSFTGGDGWSVDAIRTTPDEHVYSDNGDDGKDLAHVGFDGVTPSRFDLPMPPATFLGSAIGRHFAPRYYANHKLVAATTSSANNTLMLWSLTTTATTPSWTKITAPIAPAAGRFSDSVGGDLSVGRRLTSRPVFYVIAPSSAGNALYCIGSGFVDATGLSNPQRVWASEGDTSWAYVYNADTDPNRRGIYVLVPSIGNCTFRRDDLASYLVTRGGEFKGLDDFQVLGDPVSVVGFDPGRPNRAAIGTTHNGILVTEDRGRSWSVSHAFPEPHAFPSGIYFDDSGLPSSIEETLVAANGRGVWAVRFGAGAARYFGLVRVDVGGKLDAAVRLVDETGAPFGGATPSYRIDRIQGSPNELPIHVDFQGSPTNAHGIAVIHQQLGLPVGDYTITASFDRGPNHATVWTRKRFHVRARHEQDDDDDDD